MVFPKGLFQLQSSSTYVQHSCTTSRKFSHANDLSLATQAINHEQLNSTLSQDLKVTEQHFIYWHLHPNPTKTIVIAVHLSNRLAHSKLQVSFCGKAIKNQLFPKYLGVTLDRSLESREHLKEVTEKINTRVNIIWKLAGTIWVSTACTLHTASLARVYSAAEYCSPVWVETSHTKHLDVVPKILMWI